MVETQKKPLINSEKSTETQKSLSTDSEKSTNNIIRKDNNTTSNSTYALQDVDISHINKDVYNLYSALISSNKINISLNELLDLSKNCSQLAIEAVFRDITEYKGIKHPFKIKKIREMCIDRQKKTITTIIRTSHRAKHGFDGRNYTLEELNELEEQLINSCIYEKDFKN